MVIDHANVNNDLIYRILVNKKLQPTFTTDNELLINTELGLAFTINVDNDRSLVIFRTCLPTQFEDEIDSLRLANYVNMRLIMCSFHVDESEDLIVYHYFPFEGGLKTSCLLQSIRLFGEIIDHLVNSMDLEKFFKLDKYQSTASAECLLN